MTDHELLALLSSPTSQHAFRQLVDRHLPLVYAAARRQLSDPHAAEDAAQAVFIILAKKAPSLPPSTNLPAWLHTVTRFVCNDLRKRTRRRLTHERKAAAMNPSTESPHPSQEFSEITPHLDAALATLSSPDRAAILLRYFQNQPLPAIAHELHLSEPAAQKRIERTLQKLRRFFSHKKITLSLATLPLALTSHVPAASALPTSLAPTIYSLFNAHALTTPLTLATVRATLRTLFWTPSKITLTASILLFAGAAIILLPHFIYTPNTTLAAAPTPPSTAPTAAATPEQLHARQLLYTLRYSIVFANAQQTYSTIRDLTQLGKPILPDLCAELDRTSTDSELRYLALTLRILDDPRAVPALIRALSRTRPHSSDCGDFIYDHDLHQFLTDHRLPSTPPTPYPQIDIPRADREILAALQILTHHSVSNTKAFTEETLRDVAADQWQEWWNDHAADFLSPQEIAATQPPTDTTDTVLAAIPPNARLFSTDPAIHLGPIHNILLEPQNFWDTHAYIRLSDGKTFTLLEHASDPAANKNTYSPWFTENNINVMCNTFVTNPKQYKNTNGYIGTNGPPKYLNSLGSANLRLWQVDNARWNSLDSELAIQKPLDLDHRGPDNQFFNRDPDTNEIIATQFPITYLFLTANNTCGILQLQSSSDSPPGTQFRYRLFEGTPTPPTSAPAQSTSPTPAPAALTFTPETSITLYSPITSDPSALSLDTGKTLTTNPSLIQPLIHPRPTGIYLDAHDWLAQNHADLIVNPILPTTTTLSALQSADMTLLVCTPAAWNNLSANEAADIASRHPAEKSSYAIIEQQNLSPLTYVFKTRTNTIGLLQITNTTNITLTLHYKLVIPKP